MEIPKMLKGSAGVLTLTSGLAMLNFGMVVAAPTPAASQQAMSGCPGGCSKCSGRCEDGTRGSCFCCSGLCWRCGDEC
jgi:hypothetical protein